MEEVWDFKFFIYLYLTWTQLLWHLETQCAHHKYLKLQEQKSIKFHRPALWCPAPQIHAVPDIKENSPLCKVMHLVSLPCLPSSRLHLQYGNGSEWQVERGQRGTRLWTRSHKESDSCVCRAGWQPANPPPRVRHFVAQKSWITQSHWGFTAAQLRNHL